MKSLGVWGQKYELRADYWVLAIYVGSLIILLSIIWKSSLPLDSLLGLTGLIVFSAVRYAREHILRALPGSFVSIQFTQNGLELCDGGGCRYSEVKIQPSTVVWPFCIFLNCRINEQGLRQIILSRPGLGRANFRRLAAVLAAASHYPNSLAAR